MTADPLRPNYCTVDDVAAYLRLNKDGAPAQTDLDFITRLIPGISRDIERHTGYVFGTIGTVGSPASYDFWTDDGYIPLRPPLISLAATSGVRLDDTFDLDVTGTPIGSTAFYFTGPTYRLSRTPILPGMACPPVKVLHLDNLTSVQLPQRRNGLSFEHKVTISGIWGFPAIPDDIVDAAIILTARKYRAADAGYSDAIGTTQEGTVIYNRALPSDIKARLDAYRSTF